MQQCEHLYARGIEWNEFDFPKTWTREVWNVTDHQPHGKRRVYLGRIEITMEHFVVDERSNARGSIVS